ncbi:hypothetical protein ACVXHA_14775 [Escherichia coli]
MPTIQTLAGKTLVAVRQTATDSSNRASLPLHSTYYLAPGRPPMHPLFQAANNLHGTIYHTGYDHAKTVCKQESTAANSCGQGIYRVLA